MPKQVAYYKCLVISPGDVEDAREAVSEAITGWNAHAGEGLGVKIEAVRWESHARPEMGAPPQDIINKQIVDGCDFGVAVFWSRLGSPTAKHASGSVEEIERLLTKGANVLVYFCEAPIPQSALKDDQYQRLQAIKEEYRKRGLYAGYSTIDDLRRVLPLHVNGTMNSLLLQQRAEGQPIPSLGTATAPRPDIRVSARAAVVGSTPTVWVLAVCVENHSPADFFLQNIVFDTEDGRQFITARNFISQEWNGPKKIEPGNSYDYLIEPKALIDGASNHGLVCATAVDKIGRRFRSDPSTFGPVVESILDSYRHSPR
jgi:hypothetical protein